MEVFAIKKKLIFSILAILVMGSNSLVRAGNKEIYDLKTKNLKYNAEQLANFDVQAEVELNSSDYGYEYNGQVYKFLDVEKVYISERKKGNKKLSLILEKAQANCQSVFVANDFYIKGAEWSEELIGNYLYVTVSDNTKVTGVTVNGQSLVLGERYKINSDGRIKIIFSTTDTKDAIGTVVIKTADKDYTVDNQAIDEEFDVLSIE